MTTPEVSFFMRPVPPGRCHVKCIASHMFGEVQRYRIIYEGTDVEKAVYDLARLTCRELAYGVTEVGDGKRLHLGLEVKIAARDFAALIRREVFADAD